MKRLSFSVGDTVWMHSGGQKKIFGEVVFTFVRYGGTHYVIEVQTHIDPIYEVRDGFTLSDSEDASIGVWRDNSGAVIPGGLEKE